MKPKKTITMICPRCGTEYRQQKSMIVKPDGSTLINPRTGQVVLIDRFPDECSLDGENLIRRTIRLTKNLTEYEGEVLIAKKVAKMRNGETWHIKFFGVVFKKRSMNELKIISTNVKAPTKTHERKAFIKQFTLLAKQTKIRVTPK